MKHLLLFAFTAVTLFASSCNKHRLRGEGDSGSETRTLSSFTSVIADGSTPIDIYPSTEDRVVVTGYNNLIGVYETNVSDGALRLKFKDSYINIRNSNLQVAVYTKNMNSIKINGSGDVHLHSGLTSNAMVAEINGSSRVDIDANHFNNVSCSINGSGDIYGQACVAQNLTAKISGSGNVRMTVENTMNVRISGSGDVDYWGNPQITEVNISGSGKINKH
jgi:hypothetical protein